MELAVRLWPGVEGWFDINCSKFNIVCNGLINQLIYEFSNVDISSTLTKSELKRLATLMSVSKKSLNANVMSEKKYLQEKWKIEQLYLPSPFNLWLDWWRNFQGDRTDLKTWAAKQMVFFMITDMMNVVQNTYSINENTKQNLFYTVQNNFVPFYFDSNLCRTGNARDSGFSADTLKIKPRYSPLQELLAFIGLQRFYPKMIESPNQFIYNVWFAPLDIIVASCIASGAICSFNSMKFCFEIFSRTKYMKAFLPSKRY
jgi:CRISPR-associated protein Csb3